MPRDILIDPQRTGSGNPNIQFSGSAGSTILLEVLSEGSVQFTGVSGSLLRISDFPAAGGSLNSLFLSGTVAITGSFIPGESNGFDLGSSTKKWANIYSTSIIGSLTGSNLTAGQVVVAGAGGVLSGSNNLFWNDTSGYLGVGTSSPIGRLSVGTGNQSVVVDSTGTGGVGSIQSYNGALRINNAGNNTILNTVGGVVGIGTTNPPASKFFVSGSVTLSDPVVIIKAGVSSPTGGASVLDVQNSAGTSLLFVSGSGNVGIGTASPQEKAQVYGNLKVGVLTNGSYISLGDESTAGRYIGIFRAPGDTLLSVGGYAGIAFTVGAAALGSQTERMRIDSSGNVGIGTTTTGDRLAVNGSMSVTGSLLPGTDNIYDMGSTTKRWRNVYATSLSGSLTRLSDGTTPYLLAGTNVTITTGSNGAVTIAASLAGGTLSGAGTTNYIPKYTASTTLGNSNIFDNGTNVGIGTASPDTSAPLTIDTALNTHIALRGSGNTQRQAIIASNSGVSSNYNGLALYSNTNASFSQANTSLSSWRAILGNFDITADRFAVSRMAAGGASFSEFLTIVSSGNVGVGTTNPAGFLTVSGTIVTKYSTGLESYIAAGTYSAGTTGFYPVYAAGGSFGSNDTVIKYGAGGNNLVLLHGSTVVLSANSSENVSIGTNSYTGRLFVSGSSTAATPTMVVREGVSNPTGGAGTFDVQNSAGTSLLFVSGSGNVGIGSSTPGAVLDVNAGANGRLRFAAGGASAISDVDNFQFRSSNTFTTFMTLNGTGLGIGATPSARLFVSGALNASTPTMVVREGHASPLGGVGVLDVQNSAGTSLLFVSGSGSVGIGTISQGARFYVSSSLTGNAASALIIGGQVFGVSLNTFKGHTQLFQLGNGTETMRIDASGNVGIGTGALDSRLVVNGNSVFSGSANPDSDNTRSLGSSTKRWQTIYAATGSISNVVFSPVSTGNTYTTTFASGEAGRLTATKTINSSTSTTFFTVSANNGASMFDVSFVVSESGFSVARKYSVAAQFGSSASNVVTFKTVDTGPYSGSDLTVSFSKTANTVTTCTVSHNYSPSANIAMTIDISAISSGGSPTTVTIF